VELWKLIVAIAVLGTGARYAGDIPYAAFYFDIPSHFVLLWSLISVLGTVFFLLMGRPGWMVISLLAGVLNGIELTPFFLKSETHHGGYSAESSSLPSAAITTLSLDVSNRPADENLLKEIVSKENPDLIAVTGVNGEWSELLSRLRKVYPHFVPVPLEGTPGLALLSTVPIADSTTHFFHSPKYPTIAARISVEGKAMNVVLTHAPLPFSESDFYNREGHLGKLSRFVRELPGPSLVLGAFGTSPWSYSYHALVRDAGLLSARAGRGIYATWPVILGVGVLPLHHVLATPGIDLHYFSTIVDYGLESLPLLTQVSLATIEKRDTEKKDTKMGLK